MYRRTVTLPVETYELRSPFAYVAPSFALTLRSLNGGFRVVRVDEDGAQVAETPTLFFFDDDALLLFFSGSKGIHVGLPVTWGPEPSVTFHRPSPAHTRRMPGWSRPTGASLSATRSTP